MLILICPDETEEGLSVAASELLKPYDARLRRCYPISTRINNVANDDEGCSAPVEPPQTQARLFLIVWRVRVARPCHSRRLLEPLVWSFPVRRASHSPMSPGRLSFHAVRLVTFGLLVDWFCATTINTSGWNTNKNTGN